MAKNKTRATQSNMSLFNVTYEDGTITSNRRVAQDRLDQSFGDSRLDLARAAIEDQDAEIARRSNRRRAKIKSITEA